nr:Down syndrome cell adhesion molecule-like protein Dscam2 isoform X20 [Lepeophtheirus salmonis]
MALPFRKSLVLILLGLIASTLADTSGPVFIEEPPNHVDFSNTTGVTIVCQSRGTPLPKITWVKSDGTNITVVPGLRQVQTNGNLVLPPFRAQHYSQEVHAQTYRCIAENKLGKVQSRDVHVRAVISQNYDAFVNDKHALINNDAFLKCEIPSIVTDLIDVKSWEILSSTTRSEDPHSGPLLVAMSFTHLDGKYVVLPSGELQIRNVVPEDGFKTYKCRTKHKLTGETKLSATAGKLVITEPIGSSAPKFSTTDKYRGIDMKAFSSITLICPAMGFPVPSFRWYKFMEANNNKKLVKLDDRVKQVGGTLIIKEAKVEDSGKYLCMVNNSVGGESVETVLTVTAPLSVDVEPKTQVVDYGRSVTFKCNYKGNPIKEVFWLKNGKSINHNENTLRINSVKKDDRGMYQCFIRNEQESAQATAELKLGGRFDPPEFISHFEETIVKPGGYLSISCIAKGDPSPNIKWFIYGKEVKNEGAITVGSFRDANGDVTSHLNISQVKTQFGGTYECQASSKVGKISHMAKLNVFGAPYVKKMRPMKVVAGKSMFITCPVAGYPISNIVWEKDGRQLPFNDRQTVFPNGTLIISDIQRKEDASVYTCVARNDEGYSARSDLEVSVMEPPLIAPFSFANEVMNEGDFAQISCVITSGDLPLLITWSFHGNTIGTNTGIATTNLGPRMSVLAINSVNYSHQGKYTCQAKNKAGIRTHTAELKVNVRPRWTVEPTDKHFAQGSEAKIDCKSDGFPQPKIVWRKAIGLPVSNEQRPTPSDYKDLDVSNDRNMKIIDGTLIIKNIQKSNEGFYLCKASNGIGGISAVAKISVQAPPSFEIKKRTQTALISDNTVLQCEAKGEKPIGVLWNMNNKRLDAKVDDRYTIREEVIDDGVLSTISIKRTERGDSALFTCVATNAFGSDDTSINLIIQENPETPYDLKVLDKAGRTVKLSWQTPYNGNSNLTRYVIEFKPTKGSWKNDIDHVLVPGDQNQAVVYSLKPANSYHFRIVAQNVIGVSGPSDTITIETAEEAPSGPPVDIRVSAVDQQTLRVSWKPPLTEHWNGDILGYYVGYKATANSEEKPYLFETVEFRKEQGHEHQLQISNLEVFTEYAVVVQAFNKIGQGPMSDEVLVHTAEGAPTEPPQDIDLVTLSSQSIKVTWSSPPLASAHGIIKGYKVIYGPSKVWYDPSSHATKISSDMQAELTGLQRYTNYSIQVLAFTNGGDGTKTEVFTTTTEQDIPGPPSSVKALAMSDDSILVSWQLPKEQNGKIIQYTVYIKELDRSRDIAPTSRKVDSLQMSLQIDNLSSKARYEFWVTAHTSIGGGPRSKKVTLTPTDRIPAKIASFGNSYSAIAKTDIQLPCIAVGFPIPALHWKIDGMPIPENDRIRQLPDGSLQITRISKDDAAQYTCMVNNKYGQDTVIHQLIVNGPPDPPEMSLTAQTTDSITVKIKPTKNVDKSSIHGFTIHYKPEFGDWSTASVPYGSEEFILDELLCGQRYHLYATAYNDIGIGDISPQVTTKTKGVQPTVPDAHRFLEVSAGSVTLHLNAWIDGGCPMKYFMVEYKPKNHKDWTLVSNSVKAGGNFVVLDLNPATWYNLRVTAHNNAGFSVAEYEFATLTVKGGALAPVREIPGMEEGQSELEKALMYFLTNVNLIVPVAAALAVIFIAFAVICVIRGRNHSFAKEEYAQYYGQMNTMNARMMTTKRDGLPYEEMGYCPPPNRKLPPVPGQHSNYNTIDRIKNGNKKQPSYTTWDPRKKQGQEMPQYDEIPYGDMGPPPSSNAVPISKGNLPQVPDEYSQVPMIPQRQVGGSIGNADEDISPYATFHLLGMREENKGGMPPNATSNIQTLPHKQHQNGVSNTPKHISQTMNPRKNEAVNQPPPMYDSVVGDYEPGHPNFQQNFGNPYDCPEGMYGGSMMSSVAGYSQVSDHAVNQSGLPLPPQHMMHPHQQQHPYPHQHQHQPPIQQMQHQIQMQRQAAQQQIMSQSLHEGQNVPGNTNTVIYKGGGPTRGQAMSLPDEDFPPPPPIRSADTSLNDSNSTTQSNLTSECSEAECDREPLVKNRAPLSSSPNAKELTTEEMRKLIERNEVVSTSSGLTAFDSVNV